MLPAILTVPPSAETLAYLSALADDEAAYQADILRARRFESGEQHVVLTTRLREVLGADDPDDTTLDHTLLRLNVCRVVLAAVVERLIVSGFDTDEPQSATGIKPVAAWAWSTWQRNRMDAKQRRVHEMALRDSEAFVLVDWDAPNGRPRFTPHQRYVDGQLDGDGEGCRAFYRNDDPDQDLLFVTKRWTEVAYPRGLRETRQRLTVYYPDRIEKYAGWPGAWRPTVDDDREPWPIPWLDRSGQPLGIPVAHARSSAGMEAREAWPLQNAINKSLVDLMAESDMSAFRIMIALGWEPVDDDGNPLQIQPGIWLGTTKSDGKVEIVPGGDLSQFLNVIDSLIFKTASATDTPVARFVTTKQVAAEGTQKQQEAPLLNKCRNRQGELGNAWEDAMRIALRLENTFGRGGLNEAVLLQTQWMPLEERDTKAELEAAKLKKELGMPVSLLAAGLGLTPEQIAAWEAEVTARRAMLPAAFGGAGDGANDADD